MSDQILISREQLECLRRHLDQANEILIALGLPGVGASPAKPSKQKQREDWAKSIISDKRKARKPPFLK